MKGKSHMKKIFIAMAMSVLFTLSNSVLADTYTLKTEDGKIYYYSTGPRLLQSGSIENVLQPHDLNDPVIHVYELSIVADGLKVIILQFRNVKTRLYNPYTVVEVN